MSAFRGKLTNKGQARQLIKDIEKLNKESKRQVIPMGDKYFEEMEKLYKEWIKEGYITIEKKDNGTNT